MIELSIRFTSEETVENSPIQVSLFRPDTGTSTTPVAFTPPLDDTDLKDVCWYLEEFIRWPTGPDYTRARRIESHLEDWGRVLRQSVLPDSAAGELWQQFVSDQAGDKLITLDATDPRVLRLPWELLADDSGHLFSRGIGLRRRLRQTTSAATPGHPLTLPVRVLVVVSRPDEAGFIDPRAVSRPLLAALDDLGERVVTEFLYPPTMGALTDRLRDRHAPPVHVLHFDGHGVYNPNLGLGYLLFEDEEHKPDLVDANRLGTLLNQCGVPLMVLNACQSAKQEESNPYASVAARLIRSGVGSVLAMNYSVLVVAARKFVEAFYGGLADGMTVGKAVDEGRFALYKDVKRHTLTRRNDKGEMVEQVIRLTDWFLPALYQQAGDPVVFAGDGAPAAPRTLPRALTDPKLPGSLPAEPLHGFHGRAHELLHLERELARRAVVVLHGFGGLGKTALAAEAGRWFTRTGRFPGGAAFVSVEGGGSLQQLCSWVGQAVSGNPNFVLGEGDPVQRVADLLREKPALVILDNFESVLGREPLMPAEELTAVLDAVWTWVMAGVNAGTSPTGAWGSRLLITTRDTTFNDTRFAPSKFCAHIGLEGLARDDALDLAAQVLDTHGIDRAVVDRQGLIDLMAHLGGHPLSLYLVLPHLRQHTPQELIARFEELLPGFTTGKAIERNESLEISLDFSLRRLGEATRAALPALAVFQGGCMEDDMLAITELDPAVWKTARAELEAAALVTVEAIPNVAPPFLLFHPTLLPALARHLPPDRRMALEGRYWQRYYGLSGYLVQSDIQHPHEARAIARRELPNLRRAFELALHAVEAGEAEAETAVRFADRIVRFLDNFGRWRERDVLLARLDRLAQPDASSGEGLSQADFLRQSQRGEVLWQQGRAAEAEHVFRDLLARMEAGAVYKIDYDRALTLARLGRCLRSQGRPTQAIPQLRQALAIFERLGAANPNARKMQGYVYADLGDDLVAVGQFDDAQQAYTEALKIAQETEDHRAEGVALGQLGTLAQRQGDLVEARRRHLEALDTFRAMGEPQMEAVAWHQLGMVAQEARDWDEAERCYRESLRLEEQQNDLPGVAQTCNQLAMVAESAGRLDDAERWYLRAITLGEQLGDQQGLATRCNNLASLYLAQNRLDEARQYAERAAVIMETLDLSAQPWATYNILAKISSKQGRTDEAARWRRKALQSRDAFAGTRYQLAPILEQFQGVIAGVVAVCNGETQLRAQIEGAFDALRQGDWDIVEAIQRIWAGERDPEILTANIDYNSRAIVLAILHRLGVQVPDMIAELDGAPSAAPQIPAQDRVAQIRAQWEPVIQGILAACQGSTEAADAVTPFLDEIGQQDDWRALVAVLRRFMAGERDMALLNGLDEVDTIIAGDVLRRLGVAVPESESAPPQPQDEPQQEGVTLEQLVDLVGNACRPDAPPGLSAALFGLTQQLSADPNAPPEIRVLGRVLSAILTGDRSPTLDDLPDDLAGRVRGMLDSLA